MVNNVALIIGVVVPISLTLGGLLAFIIHTELKRKKESVIITCHTPRPRHHSYIFGSRRDGSARLGSEATDIEDGIEVCKILPAKAAFPFNDKKTALELENTSDMRHAGLHGGITRQMEFQVRNESRVQDFALPRDDPALVAQRHPGPRKGMPEKKHNHSREDLDRQLPPPPSPQSELPERSDPRESFRLSKLNNSEPSRVEAPQRPASQLPSPVQEQWETQALHTRTSLVDRTTNPIVITSPPSPPPGREASRSPRGSGGRDSPIVSREPSIDSHNVVGEGERRKGVQPPSHPPPSPPSSSSSACSSLQTGRQMSPREENGGGGVHGGFEFDWSSGDRNNVAR